MALSLMFRGAGSACHVSKCSRNVMQSAAKINSELQCAEMKLPVPWGHISGKWWGDQKITPVIALHEFRQNAAAFDKLIPKLNLPSVLALDLPGHGQSSHFPKGRFLSQLDFLIALRYVSRQLPAGQISFIGHGFGSFLAFMYAASYFKLVGNVMSIECTRHIISQFCMSRPNALAEISDRFFEVETMPPTSYTEAELLSVIKNTGGRMSDAAAKVLFSRAATAEHNKLYFSNDPRYEINLIFSFTDEDMMIVAEMVRCKAIVIRNTADDSLPEMNSEQAMHSGFMDANTPLLIRRKGPAVVRALHIESVNRLRDACRFFVAQEVHAHQHILLDSSDEIATMLNNFLGVNLESHTLLQRNLRINGKPSGYSHD